MTSSDRVIRVFISSTFRDMQRERDLLVKQVFPELRRISAERFVTLTEVDLRWGITEEQASEGKVLPICLGEIQRTRPYFIGLLGERYGWIPQSVPPEVLANEKWIEEHVGKRTSVTELEILHGVLRNPALAGHSCFYFRDPKWIDSLPDAAERDAMREHDIPDDVRSFGPAVAAQRTAERIRRLAALKETIRASSLPLVESYASPEALALLIHQQYLDLIDQLYPKDQTPDELTQEAIGHDSFASRKLLAYVARPKHTAALNAFMSAGATGEGLVITGESGCGKTALLADWVLNWRGAHRNEWIFSQYFGSTPDSTSVSRFLGRLLGELKRRYQINDEVPATPQGIRAAFPLWLAQSAGSGRIVLVLDALNQIEGDEPDRRLSWLPRYFPPHVRVLASALPGPALDTLRDRQWTMHSLPLPDATERREMIDAYLDHYRKKLRETLRAEIANAAGSANPLFLRTVLEELRQFGIFEQLPAKVTEYLAATTLAELFQLVLRRWQKDFDAGGDLVARALRVLWAARQGLSETEWLELLGTDSEPLQRQTWAPLYFAMEPHLALRSGLQTFGHDYLRQAVQAEFLREEAERCAAHLALADYFEKQVRTELTAIDMIRRDHSVPHRTAVELPWQLFRAASWARLKDSVTRVELFMDMPTEDLMSYWLHLKDRYDMVALYREMIRQYERRSTDRIAFTHTVHQVARFLSENAEFDGAKPLFEMCLAIREREFGLVHPLTTSSLNALASLLQLRGDFEEAEALFRKALEASDQIPAMEASITSAQPIIEGLEGDGASDPRLFSAYNQQHLARLLAEQGNFQESERLYRSALAFFKKECGPESQQTALCLHGLGKLLCDKRDFRRAEAVLRESLAVCEKLLGPDHPNTINCLHSLALLLLAKSDFIKAEPLLRRSLAATEKLHGPEHPDTMSVLNSLADVLKRKGDFAAAETMSRRVLAYMEKTMGAEHRLTASSLNNLALLLNDKGDNEQAKLLGRRAMAVAEKAFGPNHPETRAIRNDLEIILQGKGGPEGELGMKLAVIVGAVSGTMFVVVLFCLLLKYVFRSPTPFWLLVGMTCAVGLLVHSIHRLVFSRVNLASKSAFMVRGLEIWASFYLIREFCYFQHIPFGITTLIAVCIGGLLGSGTADFWNDDKRKAGRKTT